MKEIKNQLLILLVSVLISALGLALAVPENFSICNDARDYSCIEKTELFAQPFVTFGLSTVLVSFFLVFFSAGLNTWKRFAIWYIPIAAFLIIVSPTSGGTGFLPGGDKETATWFLSGLYFFLSVIVILRAWKNAKKVSPAGA
jgi:hypothetical protein